MTAELTAWAGGPAECADVEVEYVDPDRGRERRPLAACWSARFERVSPVRGFASFRGQRNWPGWWWFSRTGEHVGYESWVERDVLMALDADAGVAAVASQPVWLHWVSESGKAAVVPLTSSIPASGEVTVAPSAARAAASSPARGERTRTAPPATESMTCWTGPAAMM